MYMEFNEKLQQLRKQQSLTQEELAEKLFVSRTAVSKWESGRGYPNIDSLKALAKFYGVTIDELLSGEEILSIAENQQRENRRGILRMVFGLLDCSAVLLIFLPFFGRHAEAGALAVSLLQLGDISPLLRTMYWLGVLLLVVWGIACLVLHFCYSDILHRIGSRLSLLLNGLAALIFVVSPQPYAAAYLLFVLAVKALILVKKR